MPNRQQAADRDRGRRTDAARWLPTTMDDMRARGWDELDVLLVSGDAYIAGNKVGETSDTAAETNNVYL